MYVLLVVWLYVIRVCIIGGVCGVDVVVVCNPCVYYCL